MLYLTLVLAFLIVGACLWEMVSSYLHSSVANSVHVSSLCEIEVELLLKLHCTSLCLE